MTGKWKRAAVLCLCVLTVGMMFPTVSGAEDTVGRRAVPVSPSGAEADGIQWTEAAGSVTYEVTLPRAGTYALFLTWRALKDSGMPIQRAVSVNGGDAVHTALPRVWSFDGESHVNRLGNEVCPAQSEKLETVSDWLYDENGLYAEPLRFDMEAGRNVLCFEFLTEEIEVFAVEVREVGDLPSYAELEAEYAARGWRDAPQTLVFEAEQTLTRKTDSSIVIASDADPAMTPANGRGTVLNAVAGFSSVGQAVTYTVQVPESGLYGLSLRDYVTAAEGMPAYVTVQVDGSVPCRELQAYPLLYRKRWKTEALTAEDGTPLRLYLTEGEHTLTFRSSCGPTAEYYTQLRERYLELNRLYRDIVRVTGNDPDPNYNYELTTAIPDLTARLQSQVRTLETAYQMLTAMSSEGSGTLNQLSSLAVQLREMEETPSQISRRLSDLQSLSSSYAEVLETLKLGGFSLDRLWLTAAEQPAEDYSASFLQRCRAFFRDFFLSFVRDYGEVSDGTEQEVMLDVWISRGKEWGEILQGLIDTYFTPQTGIGVRLNVVTSGQLNAGGTNVMMLAIAAGTEPDVGLGIAGSSPFEYALRDAVLDLSAFEDFDRVATRFSDKLLLPMRYQNGVFGLPETQNAMVMYVRNDILQELGLAVPDTWQEVYDRVLPTLYNNGMDMCIPARYDMFLYQRGGDYYTEDGSSALNTETAYLAFREMVELYTDYGVPVSMNLFNRFRTGECPIGVDTLASYMVFRMAAPEIAGLWSIYPIPGRENAAGEIDRSAVSSLSEACVLLSSTDHPQEGWELLKWWTSDEIQTLFAREVTTRIGSSARWLSANDAAFYALPWSSAEVSTLQTAKRWATEARNVPGSYFTGRHISNAYTRCVVNGESPRDSLETCYEDIAAELLRRQKQFGVS